MTYEQELNELAKDFYVKKQKEWVEKNNVKVGTLVKIINYKQVSGWNDTTTKHALGETKKVLDIQEGSIIIDHWNYPFTALELVKEKNTRLIIEKFNETIYTYRETESQFSHNQLNNRLRKRMVNPSTLDHDCNTLLSLNHNEYIVFDLKEV